MSRVKMAVADPTFAAKNIIPNATSTYTCDICRAESFTTSGIVSRYIMDAPPTIMPAVQLMHNAKYFLIFRILNRTISSNPSE